MSMSDREALAAALERISLAAALERISRRELAPFDDDMLLVARAASKRLAQLPEKCITCDGTGEPLQIVDFHGVVHTQCGNCHGSGKVYPAELVERIAGIIHHRASPYDAAVAVLDALNETTP